MKLDLLLAQNGIPTTAPYGQASPERFGAVGGALAQAGQQVEGVAVHGLGIIRAAEEARKALAIRTEAGRIKSAFALDLHEFDANLRSTVADPDEYYSQLQEGSRAKLDAIREAGTKHPETLALVTPQLEQVIAQRREAALTHRIALTKSSTNATIDAEVQNWTELARQTGFDVVGTNAWVGYAGAALDALKPGVAVNGMDATGDKVRQLRERLYKDRAEAHERTDPAGFLLEGGQLYNGPLGAGKVALLENQARTRIDAANKAVNAEWEAWYKRVEKEEEKERAAQVDELDSLAERGQLGRQWLEDMRRMRIATGEDYRRLSKALDAPDKAEKSEPDVYDPVAMRAHSSQLTLPEIDKLERQIDGLKGRGITTKDALALKDRLRQNRDALVTKGDSVAMRQHQQAEQEINLMAGVVAGTMLEKLDPVSKRVLTTFIPELRKRSNAYEGTEPPLAVLESMKPRIEGMLGAGSQESPAQVANKLRYPIATMSPTDMATRLEAEKKVGAITEGEYRAQKGYILEYEKALQETEKTRARLDAQKGQQSKPAGGGAFRYPKAPDRKPGG